MDATYEEDELPFSRPFQVRARSFNYNAKADQTLVDIQAVKRITRDNFIQTKKRFVDSLALENDEVAGLINLENFRIKNKARVTEAAHT